MGKASDPRADHSDPAVSRLETITAFAVVGVLALGLAVVAWATPTTRTSDGSSSYRQLGAFTYTGKARPGSAYGDEGLRTGEPILTALLGPVTTTFDYRLTAGAPSDVRGTAALTATVRTAGGLTRDFTLAAPTTFTGNRTTISGRLPVKDMLGFVHQAEQAVGGLDTSTTTVSITPRVTVRGEVGGHGVADHFAPTLVLDVTGTTWRLAQPIGAEDPQSALHAETTGKATFPVTTTRTLPVPLVHPSVASVRWAGLGVGAACLLVALWLALPLWRAGATGESARIRALHGSRLVDVTVLSLREECVADVATMDALGELAKRYESMILHLSEPEAYVVWDNGMLYRYRPVTALRPVARHTAREA